MMIEFLKEGDLLSQTTEALVNTVNCVGVMGRGVALQFKNRFPENYRRYAAACQRGEVVPGRMFVTESGDMFGVNWLVNFPTKRHWKANSRLEDITSGLDALVSEIRKLDIHSIAIPPLGCGLGGLSWPVVKRLMIEKLSPLTDVEIRIFEPNNSVKRETVSSKVPDMTRGRALLLVLSSRYIGTAMVDFEFTLLALQKLLYFIQEDGFDLRLQYEKAAAGPYARNLGHVLKHIEGYFITGYQDGGDSPVKALSLIDSAVIRAEKFLRENAQNAFAHIDRVLGLIGLNCDAAYLELLASVHWLNHREKAESIEDVFAKLQTWNSRKRRFLRDQVALAYNRLAYCGWLNFKA